MPTISPKVFRHHKKLDGTYNVKICVCHKGKSVYIETSHYVTEKKLTDWFTVSDLLVNKLLYEKIESYRETISILGDRLALFDANDLKKYLLAQHQEIDFMRFAAIISKSWRKITGRKRHHAIEQYTLVWWITLERKRFL